VAPGRECWSVRRVATYFDVTPKRIYQFIEQGRLESLRLGPRQIRIPRRSIDAFLAECDPNAEA
jgi:excisionase family DNA binding protein